MSFWDWLNRPFNTPGDTQGFSSALNGIGSFLHDAVKPHVSQNFVDMILPPSTQNTPRPPKPPASNFSGSWDNLRNIGSGINQSLQQAPGTSTDQILSQLQSLQDPSRYMMNQNDLIQQAQAAANAQYDPLIASLRNQETQAQQRGEVNRDLLGKMYNGLSQNLQQDVPKVQQVYDNVQNKNNQQYQDLHNNINQQYTDTSKNQEDLYKRLNIQAAATDVAPFQAKDQAYFNNLANANQQNSNDSMAQQKQGAVSYAQQGSQIAQHEGVQKQADLNYQLSQLAGQYESQIGAHEAAKGQATYSNMNQLRQQYYSMAIQRAQSDFQNYLASVNLGRGLQTDQLNAMRMQQGMVPKAIHSLGDIAPAATAMGLSNQSAMGIQNAFNTGLNDPLVQAGIDPGTQAQLTPEAKMTRLYETGQQQGLNQQELNALRSMALQYFGRR